MKRILLLATIASTAILSSCSLGLVNEMRGGHSPMLLLDGEWAVVKNIEVTPTATHDLETAEEVHFNATRDVGGYCEGNWLQVQDPDLRSEFLWSFDEEADGEVFILQNDGSKDEEWRVLEQTKNKFVIERTDEVTGVTYQMEFAK